MEQCVLFFQISIYILKLHLLLAYRISYFSEMLTVYKDTKDILYHLKSNFVRVCVCLDSIIVRYLFLLFCISI